MKLTCDSASKLVKQLSMERNKLISQEQELCTYSYLQGEEPFQPEYDFQATQQKLDELTQQIITLKHAINQFNVSTQLPGLDLTVDAALVKMAILSQNKVRLESMRRLLPKTRSLAPGGKASEFCVRNFESQDAEAAYQRVSEELIAIQQGLNKVNLTEYFEVSLPALSQPPLS